MDDKNKLNIAGISYLAFVIIFCDNLLIESTKKTLDYIQFSSKTSNGVDDFRVNHQHHGRN